MNSIFPTVFKGLMYKVDVKLPYAPGKVGNHCLDNNSRRKLEMFTLTDCKRYPQPWYPDLASLSAMLPIPVHIPSVLAQPPCKTGIPSFCPRYPLHPAPKLSHFPEDFPAPFHSETPLGTHSCFKPPPLSILCCYNQHAHKAPISWKPKNQKWAHQTEGSLMQV